VTQDKTKASYRRNVLTLMSGSALAQALPIAASPILTRLYTPDDFGVAALFLATTAVMATVVNGRYELAIGIPESDDDAINIAALGAAIAVMVSAALLVLVFFFGKSLALLGNAAAIVPWLYLIPASVLLTGLFNVLNYTNNRLGLFKDIATANVYKSVTSTATQLVWGWMIKGVSGLIAGSLVAQLVSNIKLYRNASAHFNFRQISWQKMMALARRYKSFPKFSMWSGVFNGVGHHILTFAMPIVFSLGTLGLYNLTMRVLGAPAGLIASAFGQVFLREATQEKQNHGHAKTSFNKTMKRLAMIGAPIFIGIFFLAEHIFSAVFGEDWRAAGRYAAILTPLFFARFIASSASMMNIVFEKNNVGMYWQLGYLIINIIIIFIAYDIRLTIENYLLVLSPVLTIYYFLLVYIVSNYNKSTKM